ncbi:MAG: VWA domain-containing protein [Candidatus Binataceae bacterium]
MLIPGMATNSPTLGKRTASSYLLAIAELLMLASCANMQVTDARGRAAQSAATAALAAQSAAIAATHFASCAMAPIASPGFQAPPQIAKKPGYLELRVSVADKSGGPISGIKEADFVAYSSGIPLPIAYFHASMEAPVTIGLLIDTSGSMYLKLPTVRSALVDFLAKSDPCDELFMFAFTWRPYLLQPLTTDHAAVASHLMTLRAFGQTSMYDAIFDGLQILQRARYARNALLVITDGIDNTSNTTLAQVTVLARQQDVPIYVIGIGEPSTDQQAASSLDDVERVDAKALNELANSAGGQAFIVPASGNGFADAVASIGGRLGRGYTVGVITPTSGNSSVRPIALAVMNHPDAVVTTHIMVKPPVP